MLITPLFLKITCLYNDLQSAILGNEPDEQRLTPGRLVFHHYDPISG